MKRRWTAALEPIEEQKKSKENKYKSTRVFREGRSFASKAEALLFDQLMLEQRGGILTLVACQEHVRLTKAEIVYIPDFTIEENNEKIWCEMKGFETDVWRIKKRLWASYGPGKLRVYKARYNRNGDVKIVLVETIVPT